MGPRGELRGIDGLWWLFPTLVLFLFLFCVVLDGGLVFGQTELSTVGRWREGKGRSGLRRFLRRMI